MPEQGAGAVEKLVVAGGRPLVGRIRVGGAKNAVLPIMAAAILAGGPSTLGDVPPLQDVATMRRVLEALGVRVVDGPAGALTLDPGKLAAHEPPYDVVRRMRASFLVTGPLLARLGRARIALPGGCAIGTRPVDLHLKGLAALGARVSFGHGYVEVSVRGALRGARIYLDLPSVGATEQLMMTATVASGSTVIENAAEEPEVVDLANFLCAAGARIRGAGTKVVKVQGVPALGRAHHTVIPDRIEAGTYMVGAAITGGDVYVDNAVPEHQKPLTAKLREMGFEVLEFPNGIRVAAGGRPRPADVKTMPYPGFPTDMQPQITALLALAGGTSIVTETVFESRFAHLAELRRMGAQVRVEGRTAVIHGVPELTGAPVKATDLRAGAALVLAGLAARGWSEVYGTEHIDRGYVQLEEKLAGLGAEIHREAARPEDVPAARREEGTRLPAATAGGYRMGHPLAARAGVPDPRAPF